MLFRFYCDVSYDGSSHQKIKGKTHDPTTLVFAGLVGNENLWDAVETVWSRVNKHYEVPRFHAAHLNGRTHEYEGWDQTKANAYSQKLLRVLSLCERSLGAVGSGIFVDEYKAVISMEGRRKFGSPYIACFNSCVTGLATLMAKNPPEDRISVIIDKDDGCREAADCFEWLKGDSAFPHRHRLLSCTPMGMDDAVCLQAADLVAYEMFKGLHRFRAGKHERRHPMKALLKHNLVREGFYDSAYLEKIKPWIESTSLTGKYLVHTPTFGNYKQVKITEELDKFDTALDRLLRAKPQV